MITIRVKFLSYSSPNIKKTVLRKLDCSYGSARVIWESSGFVFYLFQRTRHPKLLEGVGKVYSVTFTRFNYCVFKTNWTTESHRKINGASIANYVIVFWRGFQKKEVFKMLRTMKSLARQNIQRKLLNKFEVRSYMKLKRRFALFLKN